VRLLDTATGKQTVLSQGSRSDRSHYRVYATATDCFTYNANRVTITRPWHMTFAFNPRQAVVINMQKSKMVRLFKRRWKHRPTDGRTRPLKGHYDLGRWTVFSQILSTLLSIVSSVTQYKCRTWKGGSRRVRDSGRLPRTCLFATTRRQLCYILGYN